jgi:hypothetical protein
MDPSEGRTAGVLALVGGEIVQDGSRPLHTNWREPRWWELPPSQRPLWLNGMLVLLILTAIGWLIFGLTTFTTKIRAEAEPARADFAASQSQTQR